MKINIRANGFFWEVRQRAWLAIAGVKGKIIAMEETGHEFVPYWDELFECLPKPIEYKDYMMLLRQYPNRIEAGTYATLWMLKHNKEYLDSL